MGTNIKLQELFAEVFDGAREGLRKELDPTEYEKRRHDFVFHMTDWRKDIDQLYDIINNPGSYDEDSASRILIGFLYHVIPHLSAAGRLLLDDIPDAFSQENLQT